MTRNERIAERIITLANECKRDQRYIPDAIDVSELFESGRFDDILGPEVTADVAEWCGELARSQEACARYCEDGAQGHQYASEVVLNAEKHRRLAKFMRALERTASL